ncbi:hypothetical protein KQX64_06715 [Rhodopseudomonas palustris]|nr:hypothetical protein KQX64_06715 [Rhodopseudomonas palustris]
MRAFFLIVVALQILSLSPQSATAQSCDGVVTPLAFFACFDDEVAALQKEEESLHQKDLASLTGGDRLAAAREQTAWTASLSARCDFDQLILGLLAAKDVMRGHRCLVEAYLSRIRKIVQSKHAIVSRIQDAPEKISLSTSFFTMVAARDDEPEASSELERIQQQYWFETFALFPPNQLQPRWTIAMAAYVSERQANDAARLAKTFAIAANPQVIRLPAGSSPDWVPVWDRPPISGMRKADHAYADRPSINQSEVMQKVVGCYNKRVKSDKLITIEEMFDCSGFWVTPKALMRCSLREQCPVYQDTVAGREALDRALQERGLNRGSILALWEEDVPAMPTRANIDRCRSHSIEAAFKDCVAQTIPQSRQNELPIASQSQPKGNGWRVSLIRSISQICNC